MDTTCSLYTALVNQSYGLKNFHQEVSFDIFIRPETILSFS
jgi:hypothetical protein